MDEKVTTLVYCSPPVFLTLLQYWAYATALYLTGKVQLLTILKVKKSEQQAQPTCVVLYFLTSRIFVVEH